jgi:hypothetical protein
MTSSNEIAKVIQGVTNLVREGRLSESQLLAWDWMLSELQRWVES